jgi:hypothetical protein
MLLTLSWGRMARELMVRHPFHATDNFQSISRCGNDTRPNTGTSCAPLTPRSLPLKIGHPHPLKPGIDATKMGRRLLPTIHGVIIKGHQATTMSRL